MSKENFTQNSASELRAMLIASGKYTEEQANNIKGKSNLVSAVLELGSVDELQSAFDNAELETFKNIATTNNNEPDIAKDTSSDSLHNLEVDYNHPDWHNYVMSQFLDTELIDKTYPNIAGLRRVAENLLGSIVESGPSLVFPSTSINEGGRASVVYNIVFDWMNTGYKREYKACADAWEGNTDSGYNAYPLCIAETRAEARALRRALKLQVAAAEEISMADKQRGVKEQSSAGEWQETDKISDTQIMFLNKKCSDLGIDINLYINSGNIKYNDIKDISRAVASKMIERLNEYQTSTDTSVDIPAELKVSDK